MRIRTPAWLAVALAGCVAPISRQTQEPPVATRTATPPTPGGPFDFSAREVRQTDAGVVWEMSHPGKVPGLDVRSPGAPVGPR